MSQAGEEPLEPSLFHGSLGGARDEAAPLVEMSAASGKGEEEAPAEAEGVLLGMGSSGGPLMEIENVESHEESRQETLAMGEGLTIQERDLEAIRSFFDKIFFTAENLIAMDANTPFYFLGLIFCTLVVLFAFLWYYIVKYDDGTGMHPKHLCKT